MAIIKYKTAIVITDTAIPDVGIASMIHAVTLVVGTTYSSILIGDSDVADPANIKIHLTSIGVTNIGDKCISITYKNPIIFPTNIYADIGGAGAYAYVQYSDLSDSIGGQNPT